MKNVIAFRKNLICLPADDSSNEELLAMSVIAELMQFGFMPTEAAKNAMANAPREELIKFHNEVIDYLKTIMGGKGNFRPFWKNFPQDQIDRSECELLLHMLFNYWTGGAYEPDEFTHTRPTAYERGSYTLFDAGTEDDFKNIFKSLVSVNQSLAGQDLDDVKWFATNVRDLPMPDVIPFKETLCSLAALRLDVPVKTVTDVLRIAVSLSGGDVSLPKVPSKTKVVRSWRSAERVDNPEREKFKFRKFKREERKFLLGLLEKTDCDVTEAVLKDQRWLRLGEILHPGEYARQFPNAFKLFSDLRNEKVQSWHGKVKGAFKRSPAEGIKELATRPGQFVRSLDWMLRTFNKEQKVVFQTLENIGDRVSNKVLYETYTHFEKRKQPVLNRTIMIRGARKRTKLPDLPAMPEATITKLQECLTSILVKKYSKLENLGDIWIDEELKKIPLPSNMRSLNPSLKPAVRGMHVKWDNPDAPVIRAFLHFSKKRTGCTIDLSAVAYGEEKGSGKSAVISWSSQKPIGNAILHSGDSWMRTGDCAEYVDIDVQATLGKGFRYVLIQLNNYSSTPELAENNYFGVMEREEPKANSLWLPKTISNCHVIRVDNKVNCAILDLVERNYVIVDEDAGSVGYLQNASGKDLNDLKVYFDLPKFSVYDLTLMHAEARGSVVKDKTAADTIFEYEPFAENYIKTLELMGV